MSFEDLQGLFDRNLAAMRRAEERQARQERRLPINAQIDAIKRRDQRIAAMNGPPAGPGVVQKVIETIADAVLPVPQTEIAKAVTWLTETLKAGPLPEKDVQERARNAGIKPRTLKRAKGKASVKSLRIGQSRWDWALP
jgi:hypothetical protein